jgi:hypothetical protein
MYYLTKERILLETSSIKDNIIENNVEFTIVDGFAQKKLFLSNFIKTDIENVKRLMLKGVKNVLKDFALKIEIDVYHLPGNLKVLE